MLLVCFAELYRFLLNLNLPDCLNHTSSVLVFSPLDCAISAFYLFFANPCWVFTRQLPQLRFETSWVLLFFRWYWVLFFRLRISYPYELLLSVLDVLIVLLWNLSFFQSFLQSGLGFPFVRLLQFRLE